jgi:hypothetical protein
MGAWMTEQVASGKNANDAYRNAIANATAEHGHQDGYSGAINSKGNGFLMVDLPKGVTYSKFIEVLEDSNDHYEIDTFHLNHLLQLERGGKKGLKGAIAKERRIVEKQRIAKAKFDAKVEKMGFYDFDGMAMAFNDKWGSPLCIEISNHIAKQNYSWAYNNKKRGEKIFVFFGYAPC